MIIIVTPSKMKSHSPGHKNIIIYPKMVENDGTNKFVSISGPTYWTSEGKRSRVVQIQTQIVGRRRLVVIIHNIRPV